MLLGNEDVLRWTARFCQRVPGCGVDSFAAARRIAQVVDRQYATVPRAQIRQALGELPRLRPAPGRPGDELRDCDDYALLLKVALNGLVLRRNQARNSTDPPPAVGLVLSQDHALNFVISTSARRREPMVFVVDATRSRGAITSDPLRASEWLRLLPLKLLYF